MARTRQLVRAPTTSKQVAGARVEKPKHQSGPVRRLENGLLNVDHKTGKYMKSIAHNSETPLLRLPDELRNKIWEYALGGYKFDVSAWPPLFSPGIPSIRHIPKNCFALSQVCRQIHAETTLLPYKLHEFHFASEECFDWLLEYKCLKIRREAIMQICLVTLRARRTYNLNLWGIDGIQCEVLPGGFPVHLFPGLKRIMVKIVHREVPGIERTSPTYSQIVEAAKTRLVHIRNHHKDVEIIFEDAKSGVMPN